MTAWYDLTPAAYAGNLRFCADRSETCAANFRLEGGWWKLRQAKLCDHDARRLRAMALLCERSGAARAGEVDFRGLNLPNTPLHDEASTIELIERGE